MRHFIYAVIIAFFIMPSFVFGQEEISNTRFWLVQSIDTVKYSRDLARERLSDRAFTAVIDAQVAAIADTGATHVVVATPYDDEFIPYLRRWVDAARRHDLKVWFRGNWSGWEGWFDYPHINRQKHIGKTYDFIVLNKNLFENGDIFTACPECENGGPGDPRFTGDVDGHREFLMQEHEAMADAFNRIDKDVIFNFNSMNGDVAELVMDEETIEALGGVITIDHYVKTQERLIKDVKELASRGKDTRIVIGELGVPVPDIHGHMSAIDQAKWIQDALVELAKLDTVIGINYWTHIGGSTALWNSRVVARPAADVLADFYKPEHITGRINDIYGEPLADVTVSNGYERVATDETGLFVLPYVHYLPTTVRVEKAGFSVAEKLVEEYDGEPIIIALERTHSNFLFAIINIFKQFGNIFMKVFPF